MTLYASTATTGHPIDGRYTVLRHLADGGMGSVYVARDERLGREVALKVMRPDLTTDPAFVRRFQAEAQAAARLSGQHAVAVYDQGRDGDLVFLAMELVHGCTLRQRLDEAGALTPGEALDIMDSVLAALAAAHAIGLVHRDVKPENVLIREDGLVKVTDFGLARAASTRTATAAGGGVLGTLAYVSPEQVASGLADARSDVYSAALMLFEMLTGRVAFEGDSPIHIAFRHVHEPVPPPSSLDPGLPPALDEAVLAGAAANPQDRPADAGRYRSLLASVHTRLTPQEASRVPPAALEHTPRPDGHAAAGTMRTSVLASRTRVLPVPRPDDPGDPQPVPADQPGEGPGPGRSRPGRRGRFLAAALATALLAGSAWVFLAGPGSAREVPGVAGLERTAAISALEQAGFRAQVTEAYSEDVPAGDVISTDPQPSAQARALLPVTVTVSRGPERYPVPEVSGQSLGAASEAITAGHLAVGARTEEYSETVAVGSVIRTSPPAGTALKPGAAVAIVTSKGREAIAIADWTGKSIDSAREELESRGITVKISQERNDDEVAEGNIISQSPGVTTLHRGDTVSFVVSKGPEQVTVPEVQGRPEDEATSLLKSAGFEVRVERIVGGVFGTARDTDPAAGATAPRGSLITLRIV